MRPLRYSVNVTLDGCCHHEAVQPGPEIHRHHAENLARADALLFGRVTYQMMEEAWRPSATGEWPEWMDDWMVPFAETIDSAKKHVVSSTLDQVDWNADLIQGDLRAAVEELKQPDGEGLMLGGVTLPLALAEMGLIDEYELVVHPVVAGHGPYLFAGLPESLTLELIGRAELGTGAIALQYRPAKS